MSTDPLLDVLERYVPEEEKRYISTDWEDYLDHLRTLPRSSITSEKNYLETSHNSIKNTLVSLTQTSHRQFIDSTEAISEFTQLFDSFQETSHSFSNDQLGALDSDVHQVSEIRSAHSQHEQGSGESVMLLKNLEKIQDILELPSLAMACVRNGYYAEALDLASHTRRLRVRYPNIKVIDQIQEDIGKVMNTMTVQLFKLLRQQVKLPTLIKIFSYLQRMHPFNASEHNSSKQLQQLYFASRLYFIRNQLQTLTPFKSQSPEKYLKRYLEIYREHVFATIVGFKSIFPETEVNANQKLVAEFLRTTVTELQAVVQEVVPEITDPTIRNSLWLQVAYCSQSLGRVGGDFWPAIQGNIDCIQNEEWFEALKKQQDISSRLGQVM